MAKIELPENAIKSLAKEKELWKVILSENGFDNGKGLPVWCDDSLFVEWLKHHESSHKGFRFRVIRCSTCKSIAGKIFKSLSDLHHQAIT